MTAVASIRRVNTLRVYAATVSELNDRRARKKAQTREQIRSTARRLFAEQGFDVVTTADIAREADVAVQTIFNHFATKEELFFDGRTPWVDGAAAAVRDRDPAVPPLRALRGYLVQLVETMVGSMSCAERRTYVSTLEASDTLRAQERELIFGSRAPAGRRRLPRRGPAARPSTASRCRPTRASRHP